MTWTTPKNFLTSAKEFISTVVSISFDHMMIHLGRGFTRSDYHTNLASAGVANHLISVGANAIHIRQLIVETDGSPVLVEYFENTTTSADGTEETIGNNNRNSSLATTTEYYTGPTITADGDQMGQTLIPSITQHSGGVGIMQGGEWILKPNTKYTIRVTNNDSQAIDYGMTLFFYEPGLR